MPTTPWIALTSGIMYRNMEDDMGVCRTDIRIESYAMTITDATTNGAHGSVKVAELPKGYNAFIKSMIDATVLAGSGGIADDATYDIGIGSAAAGVDNEVLATTEQDIVTKQEGDLSSGAATLAGVVDLTAVSHDGRSTATSLYLNVAIAAADCSADDTLTFNGGGNDYLAASVFFLKTTV